MFKVRLSYFDKKGYPIKGASSLIVRILRFFSIPTARILSKLKIAPEFVVAISFIFGMLTAVQFYIGTDISVRVGAIFLLISWLLDCVDGDMARIQGKTSYLGNFLDSLNGKISTIAIFISISVGLFRQTYDVSFLVIGMLVVSLYYFFGTMENKIKLFQLKETKEESIMLLENEYGYIEENIFKLILKDLFSGYDMLLIIIILGAFLNRIKESFFACFVYAIFYFLLTLYSSIKKSIVFDRRPKNE